MVWSDAASVPACSRLRRRDLDSEGDSERSFFEQKPTPALEAQAQVCRRKGQEEPRNSEGVLRVRSSGSAPRVFTNEPDRCDDDAGAAVVGAHAWGRRCVVMRAPSGRGVVTPDFAQQAGVWPYCQRQHDRKEGCSKHVKLAIRKGKSYASQKGRGSQKILTFSAARRRRTERPAEFSPVGAENPPADR